MSGDAERRAAARAAMTDRPTDEQIQGIIDWPVPLGRMTAPLLAREVQAWRALAGDIREVRAVAGEYGSAGAVAAAIVDMIEEAGL